MFNFLSKLLGGSKSEKDVKQIRPIVEEINKHFLSYRSLDNDALRGKTLEFRQRIREHLTEIDQEIAALNSKAEALDTADIVGRDDIYQEVDRLRKKRNEQIEESLRAILPEAFAVV